MFVYFSHSLTISNFFILLSKPNPSINIKYVLFEKSYIRHKMQISPGKQCKLLCHGFASQQACASQPIFVASPFSLRDICNELFVVNIMNPACPCTVETFALSLPADEPLECHHTVNLSMFYKLTNNIL